MHLFRTTLIVASPLLFSLTAAAQSFSFPDVRLDHEHFEAIEYVRDQGIASGYPNGTFGPDRSINRAEFTKIIVNTRFTPEEIANCQTLYFTDIRPDLWFLSYTCKAREVGIIDGYPDGSFGGEKPITFAEASKILTRTLIAEPTPATPWYKGYVEELGVRGAIPVQIPSFNHQVTRSQMAEMLFRLKTNTTTKQSRTYEEMTQLPAIHYERTYVQTGNGTFKVDVLTGDLSKGVKVVTDSATSGNCNHDCPTFSLGEYVQRNNASAGIHGSYFCPPDYGWCSGMVNSFIYYVYAASSSTFINSEKRSYDNAGGLFVFRPGSAEFSMDPTSFTEDTNITGAIAMWPALVAGGQALPNHPMMDEKQLTGRGAKGGLANRGSTVYLLLAHGATVPDLRDIMIAMGLENGINLDGGGSSALYAEGGYKVGPGRRLPNAILLVR